MAEQIQREVQIVKTASGAPRRYTLGVLYEPDVVDTQGDWMRAEEIEKAAWNYARAIRNGTATVGIQHEDIGGHIGEVVETYVAPVDMVIDGEEIRKGSWLLGVVWSEAAWEMIEAGELTGYSMGGKADKVV